jgi:ribosomal protein S18 acetylase RimI-like enzyme
MNKVVLESGILQKYSDRDCVERPYEICQLSSQDLDAVVKLRQFANETYGQRFFDRRSPTQIQQILAQNASFGLFCENDLVGLRMSGYPTFETLYLLEYLPISHQESQRHARLTGLVILPPYRRQHFGSRLTQINLNHLLQQGKDRIWATVSPFNYPSLSLFLGLKFRIYGLYKNLGCCDRFLLKIEPQMKPLEFAETERIAHSDLATQSALLDRGWVGYALEGSALNYNVVYVREMTGECQSN